VLFSSLRSTAFPTFSDSSEDTNNFPHSPSSVFRITETPPILIKRAILSMCPEQSAHSAPGRFDIPLPDGERFQMCIIASTTLLRPRSVRPASVVDRHSTKVTRRRATGDAGFTFIRAEYSHLPASTPCNARRTSKARSNAVLNAHSSMRISVVTRIVSDETADDVDLVLVVDILCRALPRPFQLSESRAARSGATARLTSGNMVLDYMKMAWLKWIREVFAGRCPCVLGLWGVGKD